jgi:hypothetical protein
MRSWAFSLVNMLPYWELVQQVVGAGFYPWQSTRPEQGEGPARIATEALAAGVNALPAGLMLGALPQGIRYAGKRRF